MIPDFSEPSTEFSRFINRWNLAFCFELRTSTPGLSTGVKLFSEFFIPNSKNKGFCELLERGLLQVCIVYHGHFDGLAIFTITIDWANFTHYEDWSGDSPYHRLLDPGHRSLIPFVNYITSDSPTVPSLKTLSKIRVATLLRDNYNQSCWPYTEEQYLDKIHYSGQPAGLSEYDYVRCGNCCRHLYTINSTTKYEKITEVLMSLPLPSSLKGDIQHILHGLIVKGEQIRGWVTPDSGCEISCYHPNRHSFAAILTND